MFDLPTPAVIWARRAAMFWAELSIAGLIA